MHLPRRRFVAIAFVILFGMAFVWYARAWVREAVYRLEQPSLPTETAYQPVPPSGNRKAENAPRASRTVNQEAAVDPLAWSGELPRTLNLAVPFLSQAPKMDWSYPYQEACEEASAIMVDAYYKGKSGRLDASKGEKDILDLVAFEKKIFGYYEDTTAAETARFLREHFGYRSVLVRDLTGPDDIKRALANGYPVMIPASGKALKNPNFKNGGPLYHMLVVKGYLSDGRWITNDPGTRKGADYVYANDLLMDAAHDWNGGDVSRGKKVMIVVLPNA